MQTQRGSTGLLVLVAIVLGLIVIAGTPLLSADQHEKMPIFFASPTSGAAPLAVTFFYHEGLKSDNYSG